MPSQSEVVKFLTILDRTVQKRYLLFLMKKLKLSSPLKSVCSSYKSLQLEWFHDTRDIHDAC